MHQRRRIVLLFGLGIVLPSLLLGYLAFRGIQNDRALVEKGQLEGTRQAAERVVKIVDEAITTVEQTLSRTVAGYTETTSPGFAAGLEKMKAGSPIVEEIFYLQDAKDIRFPVSELLYVPDGRRKSEPFPLPDPSLTAEIQDAQQLEFRDRDYPKALASYRKALRQVKDPHLAGTILNAVARVQKKAGLLREAVATYENIARGYGLVVLSGGLPLGPSAGLEICALSQELNDPAMSLQASLRLFRSLIRRDWILEKSEFEFFVERARRFIEELLAGQTPGIDLAPFRKEFQDLGVEEATLRKRTDRIIAFEAGAAPALQVKLTSAGGQGASDFPYARLALDIGDIPFLVSIEKPAGRAPAAAWGILIDESQLREDVLRPALIAHAPSAGTAWAVKGRDGATILSSERPTPGPVTFKTDFLSNFPDWSMEFQQAPPRLIKTFLLSRRGLYSFVFLLIAGILIFGLILTIRSVSHELELARMKSDFVSTVSHEFKSPLTSIRQLAEMLQSGRVPSEERRQRYYEVLFEQSERLALLTDNILSLAKIEEGRTEVVFERTDVSLLLNDVVTTFQDRVRHEGFEIRLEVGEALPPLAVDRTALSQALTNLIDNAVKYSGESRKILVTAVSAGEDVAIAVRDFGIGIKKEDIPRLFERFFRAGDELTRTVKGSGLGLTLVKAIVEAHRGRIDVESEPGKGSLFTIRLPFPDRKES